MRRFALTCLIALFAAIFYVSCSSRANRLPQYGAVTSFSLTDERGEIFDSTQLSGKVWIADFIYTNCPGPCPRMTSQMQKLRRELNHSDVHFVSFSVDPIRDTPEALQAFAEKFGGVVPEWHLLTGNKTTLGHLASQVFHVAATNQPTEHSTKFVLVDKKNQIRGYYSTFNHEEQESLKNDIEALR